LRDQIGKAKLEQITDLRKMGIFYKKNVPKLQKLLMDAKFEILAGVVRQYSNKNEELGKHLIMAFKKSLKISKW
jgi:hypothetical protein